MMLASEQMFLKCFCVLLIYLFKFIFCATINDASNFKETFIIRYFEGRKIVPVKVELDAKNQTELIQILDNKNSWISISLHDFIEEKKAFKDSNGSQCFISSATGETMEDDRKKLRLLNNGIVKGSYIPTFYILKEIDDKTFIEKFGKRIARFCNGSSLSLVSSDGIPLRRKKRQTTGNDDKGKFTHHSYGHYGHQSNNYAHYGHDTRITGTIDKDGNLKKDQTMTQYQERSQSSQTYPLGGTGNLPHVLAMNGRNTFTSPAQNQNFISSGDNTGRSRSVNFGSDNSGQFSLQTAQESGYQLNLPFGLKAGNAYHGGISSSGQYKANRDTPYHLSEQKPSLVGSDSQRFPSKYTPGSLQGSYPGSYDVSKSPGSFQPGGMPGSSYLSPPISRADQRSLSPDTKIQNGRPSLKTESTYPIVSGVSDMQQQGEIPGQLMRSHTGLGISSPLNQIKTITPGGDSQFQSGIQYQPPFTGYQSGTPSHPRNLYPPGVLPDTTLAGHQPARGYQPSSVSGLSTARGQPAFLGNYPSSLPGASITAARPVISGYQPGSIPGTDITGGLPVTSIYKQDSSQGSITRELVPSTSTAYQPDYLPQSPPSGYQPSHFATGYQDLDRQNSGAISGQYIPKALNGGSPHTDSIHSGSKDGGLLAQGYGIPGRQISQPRYPDSRVSTDQRQILGAGVDQQISSRNVPGISAGTPTNLRALDSVQGQPSDTPRDTLQGGMIAPGSLPSHPFSVSGIGESGQYSRPQISDTSGYNVPDLRSRGVSDGSRIGQSDLRTGPVAEPASTALTNRNVQVQRGGDSASSQTQIQTGAEGTAAEASAAGQYRGIGSKTQVQGGYAGNGSFSAQAQSGFTGGITQSQVQGGKQGGLSGSSAAVENIGSAQSQVQIGRPSGSASSTAQGRFSHGMTSVRAQSGRTGGSAGAESQSRGLSSSQVQVDIAGKEVTGNNDFQGTVSASVLGGSSTGQSQTQLQGGYNSGRTYAATAQGGFDAAMNYQGSVPIPETSPVILDQNLDRNANNLHTSQLPSSGAVHRPSINRIASPSTLNRGAGSPVSVPISTPRQVSHEQVQGSGNIPGISQLPGTEYLSKTPSRIQGSTGSRDQDTHDQSQGSFNQRTPEVRYPSQSQGLYHPFHLTRNQPQLNIPQATSYKTPSTAPGSLQTDLTLGSIPFDQQHSPFSGSQTSIMQPQPGSFYETPSNLQPSHGARHPYHSPTIPQQSGYHPIQQPLPELSSPTQSMGSQGRINGLQPPSNIQEAFRPSSTFRTQHGIRAPDSSTQFGQQYFPPYHTETQNGEQIFSKKDQTAPTDSGSSDGAYSTSYQQPYFRPGLNQPPFQVPSQSNGLAPGQQIPSLTDRQPTSIGIPSPGGAPISFPEPEHRPLGPSSSLVPSFRPSLTTGQQTFLEPEHRLPGQTSLLEPSLNPSLTPGQHTLTAPTTDRDISSQQRPIQRPGVREPDSSEERGCCEALKNLKRRCCGKTTQKKNGLCCSSTIDDFTQDFEDEDLTDESNNKEPCKVVKAICYIVYKPVGKARICKPTTSNNC